MLVQNIPCTILVGRGGRKGPVALVSTTCANDLTDLSRHH